MDAWRQPSPPSSRRGHGRPLEASPSRVWGFGRTLGSFLGWSSETEALPPLSLSGPHASISPGHSDGAVQHQPLAEPDSIQSNDGCRSNLRHFIVFLVL